MANILSLVWYKVLPAHYGGQKDIARFSQYLGLRHNICCLCSSNNQPSGDESFNVVNELPQTKWQFINPLVKKKISATIRDRKITHLLLEHCYYGQMGISLTRANRLKLIIHSHNIEYARFREMGKWWWPLLYLLEKKTHRAADLSLFKTEEDQERAIHEFKLQREKCMLVPHGTERAGDVADSEKRRCRELLATRHAIAEGTRIILFNGTLDYEPNALALRHIVKGLIPMLREKSPAPFLVMVSGRIIFPRYAYLKNLADPNYCYVGEVSDVETYFSGADIFVNPVVEGGGVKVKLVEALAYGLPVVSYASGARGVEVGVAGGKMSVVPDGNENAFTDAIIQNWNNKTKMPEQFYQNYSWKAIVETVAERINQL